MKPGAMEIFQQVLDLMETAEQIGLSSNEYRDLMRDVEREARDRKQIARDRGRVRAAHRSRRR